MICGSNDDKLVLSKAIDTINLSHKRNSPCFFGFLNEQQVRLIKDNVHLDSDCVFFGGYSDAQRQIFGSCVSDTSCFPLVAVKFSYKKEYKLSHRDFLGSLMATGIDRSTVGDILTNEGEAIVFLRAEILDHVLYEVTKVGKVGVKASLQDIRDIHYESKYDELSFTVSSLRLDVLVSALCCVSRDSSQKLIKLDFVAVNHKVENNASKPLVVGDIITVRKFGKFVFTEDNGFSKKGRHKITVKHFR